MQGLDLPKRSDASRNLGCEIDDVDRFGQNVNSCGDPQGAACQQLKGSDTHSPNVCSHGEAGLSHRARVQKCRAVRSSLAVD